MLELPFIPADQAQRLALIAWAEKIKLDERERCAELCLELGAWDMYDPGASAAAAIRSQEKP